MDRIAYDTVTERVTVEVSEDRKSVAIFMDRLIARFAIENVWDMVRDNLAVVDAEPALSPTLHRRKLEATAAIQKGMEVMEERRLSNAT